jgi:hypothetical protein
MTQPRNIILLRQVDRSRWCVTVRDVVGGKPAFVERIATARPYLDACRAALSASEARRLLLAVQWEGKRPRVFNRITDMVEGAGA